MFNLIFLKTFVVLARTKSFGNTANANSITQSAVSQQIHTLEGRLKCRLIDRSNKQIKLTHQGQIFLGYAESILEQYEEALSKMNIQLEAMEGVIRVATIYSIGLYRLQPVIRRFLKKHPKINVHLEYYHNDAIYERILNRTIDFGFVAYPKETDKIRAKFITDDPLVLIQCTQRPAFKKRTITLMDLRSCRYVALSKTTPTGKETQVALRKAGVEPLAIHEFENVETLKSAVLVGMGCAFVPKNILGNELRSRELEIVQVKGLELYRPLGIIYARGGTLNKPKQKFFDIFVDS